MKSLTKAIHLVVFVLSIVSCNTEIKKSNMDSENINHLQKIVSRDEQNRIIKTFDGNIYRIFDTLGRQIEWYGNYNNLEGHSNIHKFVEYSDSVIIAKEYVLEDDNKECKIINPFDCGLTKYYYKNGELYKREDYIKITSNEGKVIGHKLIGTDDSPNINPYLFSLPTYLK